MSSDKLTKENLHTAEAILSLGVVAVKELISTGATAIYLNDSGEAEMCPLSEIYVDALEESIALDVLIDKGYEEEQLIAYLKGRRVRVKYRE